MLNRNTLAAAAEDSFAIAPGSLALPVFAMDTPWADWRVLSELVAALHSHIDMTVVGISGSQGSGKSTLAQVMTQTLGHIQTTDTLSLDDFYLPKAQRITLAEQVHPLLRTRGVPGTHDWQWLQSTLQGLHGEVKVPQFSKGLDDREGERTLKVQGLVLEGWCLGIEPQPDAALVEPCNDLERLEDPDGRWRRWVNEQINHYLPIWSAVDFWVHLRVPSWAQVYAWRRQQEQQLPAAQRMSDLEIEKFIAHYERLTLSLWRQQPARPGLIVHLDADHKVQQVECLGASN